MKVLITGGSGMVGTKLTNMLLAKGHEVAHLSRSSKEQKDVEVYVWDVKAGTIDANAINDVDAIVHLAGAGVADERWTDERKKVILSSRVETAKLLIKVLTENQHQVKTFLSASGMGYYGDNGEKEMNESDEVGDDFLAEVCKYWEKSTEPIGEMGIRRAVFRISLVLSRKGGALPKMDIPVKMGLGSYFGNGKQIYSWIHIEDLCRLFIEALEEDHFHGIYNAATPHQLSNRAFTKVLANVMGRPFIPAPVPSFMLKIALGEMSETVLGSIALNMTKLKATGFTFKHPMLNDALSNLYDK